MAMTVVYILAGIGLLALAAVAYTATKGIIPTLEGVIAFFEEPDPDWR